MKRRAGTSLLSAGVAAPILWMLAAGNSGCAVERQDNPSTEVIRVTARRFAYDPAVIHLKKGKPVTLEISSVDALHGFNLPEFGVRADLVPGMTSRIELTPTKSGRFIFHCDIFCGSGHDEMSGEIVISE